MQYQPIMVAPFAGAWIEIPFASNTTNSVFVAPFAGAWIEINYFYRGNTLRQVAPFAGAWIEIVNNLCLHSTRTCRSLRGSVD